MNFLREFEYFRGYFLNSLIFKDIFEDFLERLNASGNSWIFEVVFRKSCAFSGYLGKTGKIFNFCEAQNFLWMSRRNYRISQEKTDFQGCRDIFEKLLNFQVYSGNTCRISRVFFAESLGFLAMTWKIWDLSWISWRISENVYDVLEKIWGCLKKN